MTSTNDLLPAPLPPPTYTLELSHDEMRLLHGLVSGVALRTLKDSLHTAKGNGCQVDHINDAEVLDNLRFGLANSSRDLGATR